MRFFKIGVLVAFVAGGAYLLTSAFRTDVHAGSTKLGMNLSGVSYWSPEVVFIDAFKQSQQWTSQKPGQPYGKGGPLAMDANGWVAKLSGDGQFAESLLFMDLNGHYPGGNFVCLYDGNGELELVHAAKVTERKPGRLLVKITPKDGPVGVRIMKTDEKNPIRNIRLIPADRESKYADQVFDPTFLKRWQGFTVFRFMDWGMTNNSKIEKWSDRTTLEHASQATDRGIALEYQIDLANRTNVDPWFCIPHRATDEYVREFAILVKSRLKADRKFYLEYSNECWHGGFEQGRYCLERGKSANLSNNAYEAQLRWYAQRSVELFQIVEKEFGNKDRMVRVLASQSESTWVLNTLLDWKETAKNVDAVAVAPYFGGEYGKPKQIEQTLKLSVEELLTGCEKEIDANHAKTRDLAKIAQKHKLRLIAYEGGQHLVGAEGGENNDNLMKLFLAANRHPRMKELYLRDLKGWESAGGELFCVFASMGKYSKWGSWGVLEWSDQDESTAPKLQAIREFMQQKEK